MELKRSYNFYTGSKFKPIIKETDNKTIFVDDISSHQDDNMVLGYNNKRSADEHIKAPVKVKLQCNGDLICTFYTTLEKSKHLFVRKTIQAGCWCYERALLSSSGIYLGALSVKAIREYMFGDRLTYYNNNITLKISR